MYIVVCYDVSANRRRTRLAKRLQGRIDRVQKSVFQGRVDEPGYVQVSRWIQDEIDPAEDTVRIYRLCRRCNEAVDLFGTSIVLAEEDEDVIV